MLKIRKEQMEVLDNRELESFVERMVTYLRKTYSGALLNKTDDDARKFVFMGIKKAKSYKVDIEDDVQEFIDRMMLYGPTFINDLHFSWAKTILEDPEIEGDEKMEMIEQYEIFSQMENEA